MIFCLAAALSFYYIFTDTECDDCDKSEFLIKIISSFILMLVSGLGCLTSIYFRNSKIPDPNKQAYDNIPESSRPSLLFTAFKTNLVFTLIAIPGIIVIFSSDYEILTAVAASIITTLLVYLALIIMSMKLYPHTLTKYVVKHNQ